MDQMRNTGFSARNYIGELLYCTPACANYSQEFAILQYLEVKFFWTMWLPGSSRRFDNADPHSCIIRIRKGYQHVFFLHEDFLRK